MSMGHGTRKVHWEILSCTLHPEQMLTVSQFWKLCLVNFSIFFFLEKILKCISVLQEIKIRFKVWLILHLLHQTWTFESYFTELFVWHSNICLFKSSESLAVFQNHILPLVYFSAVNFNVHSLNTKCTLNLHRPVLPHTVHCRLALTGIDDG